MGPASCTCRCEQHAAFILPDKRVDASFVKLQVLAGKRHFHIMQPALLCSGGKLQQDWLSRPGTASSLSFPSPSLPTMGAANSKGSGHGGPGMRVLVAVDESPVSCGWFQGNAGGRPRSCEGWVGPGSAGSGVSPPGRSFLAQRRFFTL